jgi:hypothetical protein
MVEDDIFHAQTHPDSASFRAFSTDEQVKHLLHLLIDARKVVFSLQSTEGIKDARIPSIFDALNSITSPITQCPLETALDQQNKLQNELASVKNGMEALSVHNIFMMETLTAQNAHISEELAVALRCIKDTNARVTNLKRPTFARVAAASTAPIQALPTLTTPPQPNQLPKPKAQIKLPTLPPPSNSHHPSRLVIQFPPDGLPERDRKDPQAIVKAVNGALERNPDSRHLRVVAAKFSVQGNLVLSTRADQTASELIKVANVITPIVNPKNLPVTFREDKKWFKIQVDGVSTTTYAFDGTSATHNSDSIHNELTSCNPSYAAAASHIVALPRWMRTYEELRTVPRSSFIFAIDDEALAKSILQGRALAVFGCHCSLRAYQDRPSRLEKYGTARSNERKPETTSPWKTTTSKPRRKTRPPAIASTSMATATTTPPIAIDPFINLTNMDFTVLPYTETAPSTSSLPPLTTLDWASQTTSEPPLC